MDIQEKREEVKRLTKKLTDESVIYLTDISGLNAKQTSNLRRVCFKANVKMTIVKNTLLKRAMSAVDKDFGELDTTLKGNTSVMFSEVGNIPAKLIKGFRKKSDKPILKGAYIDEAVYIGDDNIDTLVGIKSKEEVIGDIITLLKSPISNVIASLQSSKSKLAGIVKALSEK